MGDLVFDVCGESAVVAMMKCSFFPHCRQARILQSLKFIKIHCRNGKNALGFEAHAFSMQNVKFSNEFSCPGNFN
jgi:hypothetical protein